MAKTKIVAEPGAYDFVIERVFDAPPERVFQAHVDPKAIPRWWGPGWLTTTVDHMNPQKGGMWRFIQKDADGNEYAFNGVYHEVASPERIIQTWEFEGLPGKVLLETLTLEALPEGKTLLRTQSVFQSVADRDGMLAAGAIEGGEDMWNRLDELLAQGDTA